MRELRRSIQLSIEATTAIFPSVKEQSLTSTLLHSDCKAKLGIVWFGALFIRIYGLLQSLWWFSTLQLFLYSIRKVSSSRCTTPISFSCPDWLDYLYARMFQYNNYYCANKLKRPLYWEGKQNQLTTTFHFVLLSSQRKKARPPPPLHALLHNERFSKLYNVSSSFGSFGQRYLV